MPSLLVFHLLSSANPSISMPTPELKAPVPWHLSVLLVCPNTAAKILSDILSNPPQIPLAGFPWPPATVLHSSSFKILHRTTAFTSQETTTRHLLTGFVWDQPICKDMVLDGEIWEQLLQMPKWQQHHGKIFSVHMWARRDEFVGCCLQWAGGNLLWWCWRMHLEEGIHAALCCALCYLLPTLNYTL